MVEMDNLESWPAEKLLTARGFECENCHGRTVISYTTHLLDEALHRLTQMRPGQKKFGYYFGKALRRAELINRRNYGTR